jgi:ribosomal protein S18 acetylase RimI-like enzyme
MRDHGRMIEVQPLDVRDDAETAGKLLAVQKAAYAVEAELIGSDGIPALHETLDDLRAAPHRWLAARDGHELLGGVAYERLADGTLDICKLVVAPSAFRRGVGAALLDALDATQPAERVIVSTGTANTPALRLYAKRGFVAVADIEVVPGLWITRLERGATG